MPDLEKEERNGGVANNTQETEKELVFEKLHLHIGIRDRVQHLPSVALKATDFLVLHGVPVKQTRREQRIQREERCSVTFH